MKDLKKHILHSLAVCCVAPPQVSQGHQHRKATCWDVPSTP